MEITVDILTNQDILVSLTDAKHKVELKGIGACVIMQWYHWFFITCLTVATLKLSYAFFKLIEKSQ